jgi:hypothetical protein
MLAQEIRREFWPPSATSPIAVRRQACFFRAGGVEVQVGEVESFGEPAVDRAARPPLAAALLLADTGEARSTAQFPGLRVLSACDVDALLQGKLGLTETAGEQWLSPEPMELHTRQMKSNFRNGQRWRLGGLSARLKAVEKMGGALLDIIAIRAFRQMRARLAPASDGDVKMRCRMALGPW